MNMADADEDKPLRQGENEVDLSEEVQDYRFLSSLKVDDDKTTIPKRGEKDFEPNPTMHQRSTLDNSRQAMHDVISLPRVHQLKNHLIGHYVPAGRGDACVVIESARGPFFRTMGTADRKNQIWLLPEEALWLLERGSLDIRWPSDEDDDGEGIPMSLQAAYATFLGTSGLTLERYQVYAGLKRTGYIVQRAVTWNENAVIARNITANSSMKTSHSSGTGLFSIFHRVLSSIFASQPVGNPATGPLVGPGLYRNYDRIFKGLSLIPFHQPEDSHTATSTPKPPFRLTFEVYKPTTPFKKSDPPKPDFRIAVVDARSSQVPTLQEIGALLDSMKDDPPPEKRKMEVKLKHGYRNVLIAIVDTGIVSYLRFSDSIFGKQKVYEQKKMIGQKGGQRRNNAKSSSKPD